MSFPNKGDITIPINLDGSEHKKVCRKPQLTKLYQKKQIQIYTDGSCNNRPESRKGGWGAVMIFNGQNLRLQGREENTSSNRMEMTAITSSLRKLSKSKLHVDVVTVYADSQYAINIFSGNWQASSNMDLLNDFITIKNTLAEKGTKIIFQWVRGHAGNEYNELADRLANYKMPLQQKEETCPTNTLITSNYTKPS